MGYVVIGVLYLILGQLSVPDVDPNIYQIIIGAVFALLGCLYLYLSIKESEL